MKLTRLVPASPERAFDAWITPAGLSRILLPAPGVRCVVEELTPEVGGDFALVMYVGKTEVRIRGTYVEVERPHRLAFSWLSGRTTQDSVVRLDFQPSPDGTVITLEHTGFVDESSRVDHEAGWTRILGLTAQMA